MCFSLGFVCLSMISGCASSSFNEYFNEPVTVVEKSVMPSHTIQKTAEKTNQKESSSVQTFPVEDIR